MSKIYKNNISTVVEKYEKTGWKIMLPTKGTLNDIIAQHPSGKIHFVQVMIDNDPRSESIPTGSFVQNAFSNGAVPIRANVNAVNTRQNGIKYEVSLSDTNTNSKIILRSPKSADVKTKKNI